MSNHTKMQGLININDVSFAFMPGKPVINNLNLEFSRALSPIVLLGPSGCGKTTLLRIIAGLIKPQTGNIIVSRDSEAGCLVSMVFQEPRLLPWKTALENTALPVIEKLGKKEATERARHFLSLVSLGKKENSLPRELSGGEKQRVNLARAFTCQAEILLMDEPFQSLDIPLRLQLMELTQSLLEDYPQLCIMVTHDPRESIYMAKRVIVLGNTPCCVLFDETLDLSKKERQYGSAVQAELEHKLINKLISGIQIES